MRCGSGWVCLTLVGLHTILWLLLVTRQPSGGDGKGAAPGPRLQHGAASPVLERSAHAYVALCSIFKNEHGYVRQWVQYHRWIGVEKFYVFDHGSSPPLAMELEEFIQDGLVEVHYFAGNSWQHDEPRYQSSSRQFLSPQTWAYDNCFRWFGARHAFIGMLDADEYIIFRGMRAGQRPNLTAFLTPYEAHGGLVMQWQLFGPSGHSSRPDIETMLAFTSCIPKSTLQDMVEFQHSPHGYSKSFTNTRHYLDGCDPHQCSLDGAKYANEDLKPVTPELLLEVHWSRIVVFHYVTRSIEEYEQKMARGSGHSQYANLSKRLGLTSRGWRYFVDVNDLATDTCYDGVEAYQACCTAKACECTALDHSFAGSAADSA